MMTEQRLQRWGVVHSDGNQRTHAPMPDGYWTPWHLADTEVRRLQQQQAAVQATWVDEVTQAKAERDEYVKENAQLRKALSQYQQPGALVRFGVQHEPGPWLLAVMEDGYWTPWHIANADAVRLTAELDAALQRAEQAEVTVALLRDFTTRERALRDAVGKGGQHVGYSPSISPTTLRELERMLTDAPSTANWLGEQVKAAQQQRDAALAERDSYRAILAGVHGALMDAGSIPVPDMGESLDESVRALIIERDAARRVLRWRAKFNAVVCDDNVAEWNELHAAIAAVLAQEETR